MDKTVENQHELSAIGRRLGLALKGGEVIELVGDVGAGKTTLAKAVAEGMGITDTVSSPSYALSQAYEAPSGLYLKHYDFYRLDDPGILAAELEEAIGGGDAVIVIEWAAIVSGVLPTDHLRISLVAIGETTRQLAIKAGGERSRQLMEQLMEQLR